MFGTTPVFIGIVAVALLNVTWVTAIWVGVPRKSGKMFRNFTMCEEWSAQCRYSLMEICVSVGLA